MSWLRCTTDIWQRETRHDLDHDQKSISLGTGLVLLLAEESQEGNTSDLDNLEAAARDIADGQTLTAETSNKHFVVLVNEVQATVVRNEASDLNEKVRAMSTCKQMNNLLAVLDELHTSALADS